MTTTSAHARPLPTTNTSRPDTVPSLDAVPLAAMIDLVRTGRALTRPQLVEALGMSRKAVTQRIDQALQLGILEEGPLAPSEGGRQARTLRFANQLAHVGVLLIGSSEMRVAVCDLGGRIIDSVHNDWASEAGPEATLRHALRLLAQLQRHARLDSPWAIGVGVAGPVDFETGRLIDPPIMPGWAGFSVRAFLRDHLDCPVWVDNDTNLMAYGEWTSGSNADGRDMLYVKIGTGTSAGLVFRGRVLRGQHGAAGDIGHIKVTDDPARLCRCGRLGCLETLASGWAILAQAIERSQESAELSARIARQGRLNLGDLGEAALNGDALTHSLIETAARTTGRVIANQVSFLNPGRVVVGGGILRSGTVFLDVISDTIRTQCAASITQDLLIHAATLNHDEGIIGGALLAIGNLLDPTPLSHWVEHGSPIGHAVSLQRISAVYS